MISVLVLGLFGYVEYNLWLRLAGSVKYTAGVDLEQKQIEKAVPKLEARQKANTGKTAEHE